MTAGATNFPTSLDTTTNLPLAATLAAIELDGDGTDEQVHSNWSGVVGGGLIALETKLGIGASTPGASGKLLVATSATASAWQNTGVDIDGGAIDGSIIGGTSAAAITGTTIAGTDATDSSSTTSGALKTAGGLGVAKKAFFGDNIYIPVANKEIAVQNPTNTGVYSVGGGGTVAVMADNETMTVTLGKDGLIQVADNLTGKGALFFANYESATIVELADPSGIWAVTDSDGNPGMAIYKSAGTFVVTIKNYMNASFQLAVNVLGTVSAAGAPQ